MAKDTAPGWNIGPTVNSRQKVSMSMATGMGFGFFTGIQVRKNKRVLTSKATFMAPGPGGILEVKFTERNRTTKANQKGSFWNLIQREKRWFQVNTLEESVRDFGGFTSMITWKKGLICQVKNTEFGPTLMDQAFVNLKASLILVNPSANTGFGIRMV